MHCINYFFNEFAILELKFYFKILHKSKYIQGYDKVTQKFRKRTVLILEKNSKTRQTVFRVISCVKVLVNLLISYY
jgi:hypothetical protein